MPSHNALVCPLTTRYSFDSIDPTPCHASAHPQKHESTVAFSIQDGQSEEQNVVTVSEITTRHIRRLVSSASDFLGHQVNAAVITVPTNFTEQQKSVLDEAAKDAGVEVLQFISEPVAALLAYDARPEAIVEDKLVVIADLGGTRSDIAVIAARGGMYSILATAHDYEFNGSKLDQVLIDHFAKEFIKKHKTDPRENARSLAKLKLEAEATKKALSLGANASISIESLAEGMDFTSTINRTRYDLLASKIFAGFGRLIESVLNKADLDVLDVDEVSFDALLSTSPHPRTLLTSRARSSSQAVRPTHPVSPPSSNPSFLQPPASSPPQPPPPPLTPPTSPLAVPPSKLPSSRSSTLKTSPNPRTPWSPLRRTFATPSACSWSPISLRKAYSHQCSRRRQPLRQGGRSCVECRGTGGMY